MHQWIGSALVQIMVSRLSGIKPLSVVKWTLRNKIQWNFHQNTKLFIHKNASENIVCEMAAIVSRGDELIKVHLNTMQSQHKSATYVSGILLSSHLISMYKLLIGGQILFHYSYANKHHSTSNVQQLDCSFGLTTQKTSKLCITDPLWGEPIVNPFTVMTSSCSQPAVIFQ